MDFYQNFQIYIYSKWTWWMWYSFDLSRNHYQGKLMFCCFQKCMTLYLICLTSSLADILFLKHGCLFFDWVPCATVRTLPHPFWEQSRAFGAHIAKFFCHVDIVLDQKNFLRHSNGELKLSNFFMPWQARAHAHGTNRIVLDSSSCSRSGRKSSSKNLSWVSPLSVSLYLYSAWMLVL